MTTNEFKSKLGNLGYIIGRDVKTGDISVLQNFYTSHDKALISRTKVGHVIFKSGFNMPFDAIKIIILYATTPIDRREIDTPRGSYNDSITNSLNNIIKSVKQLKEKLNDRK